MRVLTDFHHSSLLRATEMLFGNRLHMMVYRPIGMEWFTQGFWSVTPYEATAQQYLSLDQAFLPGDGTPPLNQITSDRDLVLRETQADGVYYCADPGNLTYHRACTLEFFQNTRFDYLIASIPQHIPLFEKLIAEYQPQAKLIVQIGNEWPVDLFAGHNVLASVKARNYPANCCFYHQEFDTETFQPTDVEPTKKIYSFINILQSMPMGWEDFTNLEHFSSGLGFDFKSFGGQCRDGNTVGPQETANKMREAMMIFHVKDGGDGYGHVIYNAYAIGRPIITRKRFYRDRLAEELLMPGTYLDLDEYSYADIGIMISRLATDQDELWRMGKLAAETFKNRVNFDSEAEKIKNWLGTLR